MKNFTAPDMNLVGRMIKSCEAQKPFTIKHGTVNKLLLSLIIVNISCHKPVFVAWPTCVEKGFFTKISLCKPVYLYHIAK